MAAQSSDCVQNFKVIYGTCLLVLYFSSVLNACSNMINAFMPFAGAWDLRKSMADAFSVTPYLMLPRH